LRGAEDAHRGRAAARRRACAGRRALPRRREQPGLPGLLRAARGAGDDRGLLDQRAPRVHEHALQAPDRLPPARRCGRLGHARRPSRGPVRDVQVGAPADAGPAARAVPVLPADRRGVRVPEPRVRGLGGGRRDRDAREPGRRGRDQDVRRVHRPGRVPARLGERHADDDPARRPGRPRLHPRAGRGAVRDPPRARAGLHRAQGGHVRQHRGRPRDRRQDGRSADRAVRVARGALRAPGRGVGREAPREPAHLRGPGAEFEGARDDAPRSRHRVRRS